MPMNPPKKDMTVVVGGISGSIQDVPRSELDRVLDGLRALGLDRHTIAGEAEGTASLARSPDRVPVDRLVSAFACAERMSGDVNVGLHTAAALSSLRSDRVWRWCLCAEC